jgi:AcrR family transcriptional regulator
MKTSEIRTPIKIQLLEAATLVFSQKGIKGATTREIAREAGVHETTLFRNFEGKDALLREVIDQITLNLAEALNNPPAQWSCNLVQDLLFYGQVYQQALLKYAPFIRVLIGDSGHSPEDLKKVLQAGNRDFENHLLAYLDEAKMSGRILAELDSMQMANILTGMILADVIRRGMRDIEETPEEYLKGCLCIFIRGIEVR